MNADGPTPPPGRLPARLDDLIDFVRDVHPDGDPLMRLGDAVAVSSQLGELADHLIGHFVDQARRAGASWTQIGAEMGVTKQAVQQRFVTNAATDADELDTGRFRRFTPRARYVVEQARLAALAA